MNKFNQIDELGVFTNHECASNFYLLNIKNELEEPAVTAVNYLLAEQYDYAADLWFQDYSVKFNVLSDLANQNANLALSLMLDLIEDGVADLNSIKDMNLDDKVMYNRIINIMGGIYCDNSLISELHRIIEVCKQEGLIVDSETVEYYNER